MFFRWCCRRCANGAKIFRRWSAHFAAQVSAQNGWKPVPFTHEAMAALQSLAWPGNVRELRNMVERLMLLATESQVNLETVEMALPKGGTGAALLLHFHRERWPSA